MIAKRTLLVTKEQLAEVFNLPEGVEVLAVRANKGYEDGFEFLLASAGEVEVNGSKITIEQKDGHGVYRRISLNTLIELDGDNQ